MVLAPEPGLTAAGSGGLGAVVVDDGDGESLDMVAVLNVLVDGDPLEVELYEGTGARPRRLGRSENNGPS